MVDFTSSDVRLGIVRTVTYGLFGEPDRFVPLLRELGAGLVRVYVTRRTVSQYLRLLRVAGLVAERREGTRRFYRTRPEGLDDVRAFLDEFSGNRLEALSIRGATGKDEPGQMRSVPRGIRGCRDSTSSLYQCHASLRPT